LAETDGFSSTHFTANLKAELEAFQKFYEILKREEECLARSDVEQLIALAQLKSENVLSLTRLSDKRNQFLISQNLTPDQHGIEMLVKTNPLSDPGGEIPKIWRNLLSLAQEAQQLNLANGIMIESKLRHNQQALGILQSAVNQATLYGPDGKTHASGTGRPLGKV